MATDRMTQNKKIKEHLVRFGSITTLEAVNGYKILRLSARIWDLRHEGCRILSAWHKTPDGARVAKYIYLGEVNNNEFIRN